MPTSSLHHTERMTDLLMSRPEMFAALPVTTGPEKPAKCVPDAEAFWKLQERVDALESNMYTPPNLSRVVGVLALLAGLLLGVALAAATVLASVWVAS